MTIQYALPCSTDVGSQHSLSWSNYRELTLNRERERKRERERAIDRQNYLKAIYSSIISDELQGAESLRKQHTSSCQRNTILTWLPRSYPSQPHVPEWVEEWSLPLLSPRLVRSGHPLTPGSSYHLSASPPCEPSCPCSLRIGEHHTIHHCTKHYHG